MESQFGKKLFRLLLLFSFLPLIVLAVAGYFLVTETTVWTSSNNDSHVKHIAEYFYNKTFNLINKDLQEIHTDALTKAFILDFAFSISSDSEVNQLIDNQLPEDVKRQITQSVIQKSQGLVENDSLIYLYSSIKTPDNIILCGGVMYGSDYAEMLSAYQHDHAIQSTQRHLQKRYVFFLGFVLVVLALLTGGLAYIFSSKTSRNLSRPLVELSQAASGIADGNFKQSVTITSAGEIATLVNSFNRMAAQLDSITARLTQTERVAAWRHVARRFAHELKNPLQPIMVSLYRIEKSLCGTTIPDDIKQNLHAASEELQHLTTLAERFSTLAKLPPPILEPTDLCQLVSSVAELYREELSAYDFVLEKPSEPVYAKIDTTYFREALHNLLLNAIEASPKGSRINLSVTLTEYDIQIKIHDHGEGMSDEVRTSAHMPYFTTKKSGSGLGLAIVEKTVSEVGGHLTIDSTPGQGTIVTIHLPKLHGTTNA